MIAIKLHGVNSQGFPPEWPARRENNVVSLPEGFDLLFATQAEYDAYRAQHQALYDLSPAAQAEPAPLRQETDIVLQRLTEQERDALFTAARDSTAIAYFVARATAAGAINQADPQFPAAAAALDALGIILAPRWAVLLA
ncbi:MAG: hypothetical protein V4773_04230 [Verrucomicrobiota bacterium]